MTALHAPNTSPTSLETPLRVGAMVLPNRVIMAPLTRCRAQLDGSPHALNAMYYRQRVSAGLLISEATQVSQQGIGYPLTPGIYTPAHVAGWKLVTDSVHQAGGRIFCQLWHCGRTSHNDFQVDNAPPVSSSAIARGGVAKTYTGEKPYPTPRALETEEVAGVIEQYRHGAAMAKEAGFDGVELHGANGYLPDQFLRDGVNKRTDRWGGSIENRARFMLEAAKALISVWGANRVGVRLSPSGTFGDMSDSAPKTTYEYVVRQLDALGVAYLHIMEAMQSDFDNPNKPAGWEAIPVGFFRPFCKTVIITNSGFTKQKANDYLARGDCDAVAFGVPFIANPDLPERFQRNAPLNTANPATFYGGGAEGYTDYPFLPTVH